MFNPLTYVNLGMDIRYSGANVEFDSGQKRKAGGFHAGLIAGYKF